MSGITSGRIKSCGCLNNEKRGSHKRTHGESKTRLYKTWLNMMSRCYSEKHLAYPYYGRLGVTVCEDWKDYLGFKSWALANGYTDDLTIERKNNQESYCPKNCEWITMCEQFSNRSTRIGKSGYSCVAWYTPTQQWRARITVNNKTHSLGYFYNLDEAIAARKAAEKRYWGKE